LRKLADNFSFKKGRLHRDLNLPKSYFAGIISNSTTRDENPSLLSKKVVL
jgi:hypothetical protein